MKTIETVVPESDQEILELFEKHNEQFTETLKVFAKQIKALETFFTKLFKDKITPGDEFYICLFGFDLNLKRFNKGIKLVDEIKEPILDTPVKKRRQYFEKIGLLFKTLEESPDLFYQEISTVLYSEQIKGGAG